MIDSRNQKVDGPRRKFSFRIQIALKHHEISRVAGEKED
jgi:hypothetical protein